MLRPHENYRHRKELLWQSNLLDQYHQVIPPSRQHLEAYHEHQWYQYLHDNLVIALELDTPLNLMQRFGRVGSLPKKY